PGLRTTARAWLLDVESELLFAGDPGTNDPSLPGRRYGVEIANAWDATPWLTFDVDLALARSRLHPAAGEEDVESSMDAALAAGGSVHDGDGFVGSVRLRHFRSRASAGDDASTVVNFEAGYAFDERTSFSVELANVFDAYVSDMDSFYASRLPGGPAI